MKLDLDLFVLQGPLLDLPILKEALFLSASSPRWPAEQRGAFSHTQHTPMRSQFSSLAAEVRFRVEHSDLRTRLPSPMSVTIEQLLF